MEANVEMLNYISQNAEMGVTSITKLLDVCEGKDQCTSEFRKLMESQLNDYRDIYKTSEKLLNERDKEPKGIGAFREASTYCMINMKTMMNKTPGHISEMLMQGSVMGISQITKKLDEYKDFVDKDVYSLGEKLLKVEDRNLADCRKFLGTDTPHTI